MAPGWIANRATSVWLSFSHRIFVVPVYWRDLPNVDPVQLFDVVDPQDDYSIPSFIQSLGDDPASSPNL
jgi:hypothetical protein